MTAILDLHVGGEDGGEDVVGGQHVGGEAQKNILSILLWAPASVGEKDCLSDLSQEIAWLQVKNSDEPLINASLDKMSDDQLDFFLARFVAEVRKTDGAEYPGRTIYEMI